MLGALRLVRPGNVVVSWIGTAVGGLVAWGSGWNLPPGVAARVFLLAFSTALVTIGGNVLNDLTDREGDKVNHPDRPLVTGEVRVRSAQALCWGGFVGGAILSVPVALYEPIVGAIVAVAVGALIGYEFRWKREGLAGNLLVALLTALVFVYGAAAVGHALLLLPFAAMAFLATLSREVIKDLEDVRGDVDRRTLPRTHGPAVSSAVARGAIAGAIVLSAVPLLWFARLGSAAGSVYLGVVAVADAVFVVSVVFLPLRLRFEQQASKAAMAVALVAFLAVAFR